MDNNIDIKNDKVTTNDKVTARIIICAAFVLCGFVVGKSLLAVETTSDLDFEIRRIYFASSILTVLASIWIIGLVACVWGPQPADGKEGSGKQAFDTLTKTITPLITMVLVFYFTLPTPSLSKPSEKTKQSILQVDPISISLEKPKKGVPFTISTKVSEGKPPYTYTLSFSPTGVLPPITDISEKEIFTKEVTVPTTAVTDTKIHLKIEVKDNEGKSSNQTKDFTVE